MKPKLSFYTNIPTPYQEDFFSALAAYVELTVVYYATTERGRQWVVDQQSRPYAIHWLRDSRLACFLQRWLKDYHFSWRIFRTVLNDPADYVIVGGGYWIPNAVVAMLLARWRGRKVAFFGERLAGRPSGWRAIIKRLLLWPLRYACVRVFAIGQEAADTYTTFGVDLPKTVVPYSVAIEPFIQEGQRPVASDGLVRLLSSGALIPRKGMDTLIRAVRALNEPHYATLRLQIVGEGPGRPALEQLIGDDPRIELLGFADTNTLPTLFQQADAFVFASRYDGWGVVINEAIAAGLPIISSDAVGATREWVRHGLNGFVCPPDDVAAFRTAIGRIADEPALRDELARYNRAFREQTSSAHYARLMFQVIQQDMSL
ncbi:putative glycosyltransferase MJ1607 [Fibrisoma limi BUZ 3]|uniref:Putative glycosyltransferase MJ1607 n=1 Tax=Fibrisoma limi BUZ 3 TaxID=1185876 RepID=I2GCI7_9BACT|nr:glycosyltransferase family 4 protein [Fibrisoma limi]CCH51611.1 putative glycosyltransferase MJ1607 [Fibrisoma limi BUZ 3]